MSESNLAKFDSVRQFIELGNLTAAIALLSAIDDTNAVEEYCKMIFEIGINKLNIDSVLAEGDSSIFYEIGNLHALTTGEAAFMSRNMLFYEVHDGALGQGSRIANSNKNIETSFEVSIFPNPTTENLFLKYKEILPQQIKILDVNQRVILNSNNINYLILKNIDAGVYFVQFIKNGRILRTHKIVKL